MSLKGLSKKLRQKVAVQFALLLAYMEFCETIADNWVDSVLPDEMGARGQTSAVLTVVVLGVVLIVGVLIFSQIQTSLPAPSNSELNDASSNVTSGFADAMNLAPVILIVLIASVVLAIVQRFR